MNILNPAISMRYSCLVLIVLTFLAPSLSGQTRSQRITLPNGWGLTPAGTQLTLGDLPLNCTISHGKTLLAVTNNGQSKHSLQLVNLKTERLVATVPIPKAWVGLAFGDDDRTLYASGGYDNWILRYAVGEDTLLITDTLVLGAPWPRRISPGGLAVDEEGGRLYVVTKDDSALYAVDLASKRVVHRVPLGGEGYTCLLSRDRTTVFASCWGTDMVRRFSTKDMRAIDSIRVGDNPNDMCLSADGALLYVANANDNSVSVIDLAAGRVIETLNAALYPDAPSGSTTNSVAMSEDGETLYIANADNNCLAVFDVRTVGKSRSLGFIPTGWYPTSVRIAGAKLYVANGKGLSSMANPYGPNPAVRQQKVVYQQGDTTRPIGVQYIGGLFKGALSIIPMPDQAQLATYSRSVYENSPYTKEHERLAAGEPANPVPQRVGDPSPITHVFYIIKENRTYDQVLGDMPEGNGDTSLVLFGERITPNEHALAREFVLLDNFYVDGEVSADGHNWSMGAYATDYLEKTWPTNYGGRGGEYEAEGARGIANNKLFIWDQCRAKGISYRTYGEFTDGKRVGIKVLEGHVCPTFTSWDQAVRDTTRFAQWKREFDSLVAVGEVPRFNTLRFINDHTEGLRRGRPSPFAAVADNDLAVGLFVEHLSKSPLWNESVVFIVEDDAQNGPDHVDAHRSTAYVAGGRVKRHLVDHSPYTTSSILRTIELILGLDPMSQYDAGATPMWRCFTPQPGRSLFTHLPNRVDLGEINLALNEWQQRSEEFDFTMEDRAPDDDLNRVLWFAARGAHVPFPAINRAAFLSVAPGDDGDD